MDYQEIIDNLKDEDVFKLLEQLGASPIDKGDYFICKTVCHNENPDEASSKLYYYKNSHIFYCYTNDGAMSIFKFLKNYYETRSIIYDWYEDILQVILKCSLNNVQVDKGYKSIRDNYAPHKNLKELPHYSKEIIDVFTHYYPVEWLQDNISKKTMDKFNIRYSISQNKIIIPHYDINGELVGIRGRALNQEDIENFGKYMPVQIEGKWYSHPLSLNLYGLNFNKDEIKHQKVCYIYEAEKSVMQLENFNMPHVGVASCGSNLNKFQINLLIKYCQPQEIILCYDREENKNTENYFDKLYKMCHKYSNYVNMSFIYDRNGLTQIKDSPTDRGEQVFRQLLKERVHIK